MTDLHARTVLPSTARGWLFVVALLAGACSADPKTSSGTAGAGAAKDAASGARSSSGSASNASSEMRPAREVRTARAELVVWPRTVRVSGELVAFEDATLSTKVAGRLVELSVDLGSKVELGQVVARIDRRDQELRVLATEAELQAARARLGLVAQPAQDAALDANGVPSDEAQIDVEAVAIVREARADLDIAKLERERLSELSKSGVSSKAAFDAAESALLSAESRWQESIQEVQNRRATLALRRAELALARQQLADSEIKAPFAGAVTERLAGTGDYLSVGDPVASLARIDPLRVRIEVPERDAPSLRIGQAIAVRASAQGVVHRGVVARISPEYGARNRTLRVEAELANQDGALRAGAFVQTEVEVDAEARALSVPAEAIVSFAGIDKVLVIEDGKVVEKRVTLGRKTDERVEVLDGLEAGAEVVLAPGNLQGGAAVKVAQ